MTLDEAIKHCLEVAEQNEQGLYDAIALGGQCPTQEEIANCEQCATEHRQLAEWLTELKEAKRLLKLAVSDFSDVYERSARGFCAYNTSVVSCDSCPFREYDKEGRCGVWRLRAEALKLIGDERNEP